MEFKPPSELKITGNLEDNWKKWYQKLKNYMLATEKDKKGNEVKTAILLNLIGDEGLQIYDTFKFDCEEDKTDFEVVVKRFEEHCKVRKNVMFERFKFFKCHRNTGQSLDNYLVELRTRASGCEFESQEENLIRDQIVLHLEDEGLQERILREQNVQLGKVIEFIKAAEISREQVRSIQCEKHNMKYLEVDSMENKIRYERKLEGPASGAKGGNDNIHIPTKVRADYRTGEKINRISNFVCQKCNRSHSFGHCPAFGKFCTKCNRRNHFAVCCPVKVVRAVSQGNSMGQNITDDEDTFFIDLVDTQFEYKE